MFKSFKITPFLLFVGLLIGYALTLMYINNKTVNKAYDYIDDYQIAFTINSIEPMIDIAYEFSLYSQISQKLDQIVKNNEYISAIEVKNKDGDILSHSNPKKVMQDKDDLIVHKFTSKDNQQITIEIYPTNITREENISYKEYSEDFTTYQILGFVLLVVVLILYTMIGQFSNKLMEKKIEELSQEKDALLQQSKLALMGEMISNIAHQWRQPLNSISLIINNINISKELGKLDDEEFSNSTKKIEENIQFMSKTIDDFRNFYKPNKDKEQFSIKEAINLAISIVDASFQQKNIIIDLDISQDIFINGHKNEFAQVIVTLLENSKDALLSRSIKDPKIYIGLENINGNTVVSFEDNAGGIESNIIHKVFDPYFTTKHKTQGTGLGLYIANMLIKSIDGVMKVSNTKDGVRFEIVV